MTAVASSAYPTSTVMMTTEKDNSPGSPTRAKTSGKLMSTPTRVTIRQDSASSPAPRRPRMNSRDIPRSYAGQYGAGSDDLLPFEIARAGGWWVEQQWFLIGAYILVLFVTEFFCAMLFGTPEDKETLHVMGVMITSWTMTNALHLLLTFPALHWLKGTFTNDVQGEMSHLTLWEQLEATAGTGSLRRGLMVVPTLLCYAACHLSNYDLNACVLNICIWAIGLFGKLPFMNGVRIFGINRTAGIDDFRKEE